MSKSRFQEIRAPQRPRNLLDQVRDAIRVKHYAFSTEKTYVYWVKRFVLYHNKRHPLEMGEKEISEFLTYLAVVGSPAALDAARRPQEPVFQRVSAEELQPLSRPTGRTNLSCGMAGVPRPQTTSNHLHALT